MATVIACANCAQKLRVPEACIGQVGRCPTCRTFFEVVRGQHGGLAVRTLVNGVLDNTQQVGVNPPAQASNREDGLAELPTLTRRAAIVRCPSCTCVVRVRRSLFNEDVSCPQCSRLFVVLFEGDGVIPFDCPHCGFNMAIRDQMMGRITTCGDCNRRVRVPTSPVLVRLVREEDRPRASSGSGAALGIAAGVILAGSLLSHGRGYGRRCILCGRSIRNPSMYCYRCRPY